MKPAKTRFGHDARCCHCLKVVYEFWQTPEPPPVGCAEGHNDDISKCGAVYNSLVAIVIGIDHMNQQPNERQQFLLKQLGPKADALMAHIRSGKMPLRHKPKECDYDSPRPAIN